MLLILRIVSIFNNEEYFYLKLYITNIQYIVNALKTINEKIMENAIVDNPGKFLKEKGLVLLERQYRIGSYIFDLLFEDRHRGKLIVEIQMGTLDRIHTYKILDYYHEYKEKNPQEFIDIMVIANNIPPERKKRLNDLAISYQEIPESEFLACSDEISSNESLNHKQNELIINPSSLQEKKTKSKFHFKTSGPSAFINGVREALKNISNSNWRMGGTDSLMGKHLPTTQMMKDRFGDANFIAQIWFERPKGSKGRCKFEIMGSSEKRDLREKIAGSIRSFMSRSELPKGMEVATGSTIVAIKLELPLIKEQDDDIIENVDRKEILKVIEFYKYLDKNIDGWNKSEEIYKIMP